jgi:hypothetical protein
MIELIVEDVRLDQIGDAAVDDDARIEHVGLEPLHFLGEFDIRNDEPKSSLVCINRLMQDAGDSRGPCHEVGEMGVRAGLRPAASGLHTRQPNRR